MVDLLNSAVEAMVDCIGTQFHELTGYAKDFGSVAALITLLLWEYVWVELAVMNVWFNAV